MYLLARYSGAREVLFDLLQNGALKIAFRIEEHVDELRRLLHKYRDVPMSLADACVVPASHRSESHCITRRRSQELMRRPWSSPSEVW